MSFNSVYLLFFVVLNSFLCENSVGLRILPGLVKERAYTENEYLDGKDVEDRDILTTGANSEQPLFIEDLGEIEIDNATMSKENDEDDYDIISYPHNVDKVNYEKLTSEELPESEQRWEVKHFTDSKVNISEQTINNDSNSHLKSLPVGSNIMNNQTFDVGPSSVKPLTDVAEILLVKPNKNITMNETVYNSGKNITIGNSHLVFTEASSDLTTTKILMGHTFLQFHSEIDTDSTKTTNNKNTNSNLEVEFITSRSKRVSYYNDKFYPTFATTEQTVTSNMIDGTITSQMKEAADEHFNESNHRDIGTKLNTDVAYESNGSDLFIQNNDHSENLPTPEKLYVFNVESYYPENSVPKNTNNDKLNSSEASIIHPMRNYEYEGNRGIVPNDNLFEDYKDTTKQDLDYVNEKCRGCDVRILPIRPLEQISTPIIEEETLPISKIVFADLPEGRELQINSLGLSDGIFLFRYISEFLSWIQPNDFPVGLLKDALKSEMTWISLITQSLQVEAGFVACLVAGVLFALAVPIVVLSHACYRMGGQVDDCSEDNAGWAGSCRRRTLVFILQLLLILLCAGMVAMFVTNEQLSSAVVQSSDVLQTALSDVSTYVQNSHLQLHFLLTQSLDQTIKAVFADLDNVDTLLGRPIQKELVRETGLDVALDSLADMTKGAKSITLQVERFMEEVRTAQDLLISSRDKLSDLRQQVELFRRACGPRDRAMCDSIDASGLEVTLKLDRLKTDDRLNRMRRMGGVGLELAVSEAKDHFQTIPARVEADTRDAREDVRRLMTRQRAEMDEQTLALERLARDLTNKVGEARYQAGYWTQDVDHLEYWRWIVCMGGGAAVLMIWMMLLCSMCCGCCGSEKAAGPTILITIVLLCLFSTALWTLVMIGLVIGGHSEVFLCRPLYDEPEFNVLSRLVDQPGVFYDRTSGGFIGNVIYGNGSIEVPIKNVLRDCQDSRPVYPALGLHRVIDVESAVSQSRWGDINSHLRAIRANLSHLEVLSPVLTDQLGDLLSTLSINFTEHRIQMSKPVTGKDLDSFAKQLDNIGNQLRDLATASRIETLSARTRRLIDSHIRPLEGRKDALVYQLTALEVQTQPLQRQVNQSLSHLKTIQFFINSQGEAIAQRKSQEYVNRLWKYVDQLRDHVMKGAKEEVAPCRPLWDIFNNTRLFLCRHTVDPLNGFWFATMWCLLILLIATPVCLKLVDYYRAQGAKSSGSPSENLMSSEQGGGWSTPGYDIKCSKEYD